MPGSVPQPTLIAHLTSLRNLHSIVNCGELYCNRILKSKDITYRDISNLEIQRTRATFPVPCGPGGTLHDYVPFFFNPLSPMLYRKVRDYYTPIDHRQLVHILTTVQAVAAADLPFVFTTGHATMVQSDYYENLDELENVDWNVMAAQWWSHTQDEPDRQCRREAEFLVHGAFPLFLAQGIAVFDDAARVAAEQWLLAKNIGLPVTVRPDFFYRRR